MTPRGKFGRLIVTVRPSSFASESFLPPWSWPYPPQRVRLVSTTVSAGAGTLTSRTSPKGRSRSGVCIELSSDSELDHQASLPPDHIEASEFRPPAVRNAWVMIDAWRVPDPYLLWNSMAQMRTMCMMCATSCCDRNTGRGLPSLLFPGRVSASCRSSTEKSSTTINRSFLFLFFSDEDLFDGACRNVKHQTISKKLMLPRGPSSFPAVLAVIWRSRLYGRTQRARAW